jgi:ProQ/FINO family
MIYSLNELFSRPMGAPRLAELLLSHPGAERACIVSRPVFFKPASAEIIQVYTKQVAIICTTRNGGTGDGAKAIAAKPCSKTALQITGGEREVGSHLKIEGLEAEILPILVKTFPRAFFPAGPRRRPLRVGIFDDLNAALPPEIDRARLKLFLGLYTSQPSYLRELKPGAIRIGLNGCTAGRVSPKESASAAARLQKLHGLENGPALAEASASCPASAALIPPGSLTVTPHADAIDPPRTPFRVDLAEGLPGKKGAQPAQRVIVVVKKRKVPLEGSHHISADRS